MRKSLSTIVLLCLGILSLAQKQADVRLVLRDGNTISGTTQLPDVTLKTDYGMLHIPVQHVNAIEIGTGNDKAVAEKALAYLKVLNGEASDDIKKGAYADLVKLGPGAISAITDFENDPKYATETVPSGEYTIEGALSEIRSTGNADAATPVLDIVSIDNQYSMGGTYEFQKLDVKTEYGTLSIPKEKIKSLDISVSLPVAGNEMVFKLMAGKYISGNQNGGWLKTGLVLKQGQKFTITATGEVTLASLSNQKYKPDGSYISTDGTSYPVAASGEYNTAYSYPSYGNVVYRIGESSTEALKAGAKYSGAANTGGMLFLSIYETVYNSANSGFYTVKVSLK